MTTQIFGKIKDFVICNPDKCIGCHTCLAACYQSATERGKLAKPRLTMVSTFSGTMPNQCRQCEDAPCAKVCPTGALKITEHMVSVNEQICIGCKMCILACPFGCLQPASEPMPSVDYTTEHSVSPLYETRDGSKTIAIKCDLCEGSADGPACVNVCPVHALIYVRADGVASLEIASKSNEAVANLISSMGGKING